ncbi:hypothetical protein HMPREF1991_00749 [Hoylesella loescheii DSM 19665 = JCM 12249 = ATCC 15930]|uniref:Uncharacterized protein n=1 Tax=Hoylesella loescheii DSM 19665 = JCM 12249 = ATCC 15930 TaxID=1122985 RepID=A0A069QK19_HOYLO|nr:hypothetical protein HMPREF1991_00749 [Hoylesella loescheii DSM 19665 = JCM 12249 = ATCC 15930]
MQGAAPVLAGFAPHYLSSTRGGLPSLCSVLSVCSVSFAHGFDK